MGHRAHPNILRLGFNKFEKSNLFFNSLRTKTLQNSNLFNYIRTKIKFRSYYLLDYKISVFNLQKVLNLVVYKTVNDTLYTNLLKRQKWNIKKIRRIIKRKKHLLSFRHIRFWTSKNYTWRAKKYCRLKLFNSYINNKILFNKVNFIKTEKKDFKSSSIIVRHYLETQKLKNVLESSIYNDFRVYININIQNSDTLLTQKFRRLIQVSYDNLRKTFLLKRTKNLLDLITISTISLKMCNARLLAEIMADEFTNTKNYSKVFYSTSLLVESIKAKHPNIIGIRFLIWGKRSKSAKTKKYILKVGNINFNTYKNKINQWLEHCYTSYGVFGIRVSLIYLSNVI